MYDEVSQVCRVSESVKDTDRCIVVPWLDTLREQLLHVVLGKPEHPILPQAVVVVVVVIVIVVIVFFLGKVVVIIGPVGDLVCIGLIVQDPGPRAPIFAALRKQFSPQARNHHRARLVQIDQPHEGLELDRSAFFEAMSNSGALHFLERGVRVPGERGKVCLVVRVPAFGLWEVAETEKVQDAYVTSSVASHDISRTDTMRPVKDSQFVAYTAAVWCMLKLALCPAAAAIMIVEPTRRAIATVTVIGTIRLKSGIVSVASVVLQRFRVVVHLFYAVLTRCVSKKFFHFTQFRSRLGARRVLFQDVLKVYRDMSKFKQFIKYFNHL